MHARSVPVKVSVRVSLLLDLLMGVSPQCCLAPAVSDDTVQGLPGAGPDTAGVAGKVHLGRH